MKDLKILQYHFISNFNLLGCKLDNFTFKVLYWVILNYIKAKQIYQTPTVPCEKSKTVSFAYSKMKNIVVFPSRSKYLVTLISCLVFGSASSACCLVKSIAISL